MVKNSDIFDFLCAMAPLNTQMDFDNSGFLMGRKDARAEKVLLTLDVTGEVVREAAELGVKLIISHHPVIFDAIKTLTDTKLLTLAEKGIAVISMHTNLDIAQGGVNDVLISLFKAEEIQTLSGDGCGRVGLLREETPMPAFLEKCKALLKTSGLRFYDAGKPVKLLAVMGGSGGDYIEEAVKNGCDTFLTADIKYHQFLLAKELELNLIDGDHFCTENPVIYALAAKLKVQFPEISFAVSKCHTQTVSFC